MFLSVHNNLAKKNYWYRPLFSTESPLLRVHCSSTKIEKEFGLLTAEKSYLQFYFYSIL